MFYKQNLLLAITATIIMVGCGGLSSSQNQEVSEAIKALGKVSSAIEIGVNYTEYSELVLEAKSQVNEATAILKQGQIRSELELAIDSFVDARDTWNYALQNQYGAEFADFQKLYDFTELGKIILPKYSLPKDVLAMTAVQIIWNTGNKHLKQARGLFAK